jgi:hypothetical protein
VLASLPSPHWLRKSGACGAQHTGKLLDSGGPKINTWTLVLELMNTGMAVNAFATVMLNTMFGAAEEVEKAEQRSENHL